MRVGVFCNVTVAPVASVKVRLAGEPPLALDVEPPHAVRSVEKSIAASKPNERIGRR